MKNEKLVRGLDYYTHTVFEFTTDHLGAQSAVLAGGRYDGLIELMGGPATPGVGWASGMERLALLLEPSTSQKKISSSAFIPMDTQAEKKCWELAHHLRSHGLACEVLNSGNMGKKMKKANKMGAAFALILGESEMSTQSIAVKNLATGEQKIIKQTELVSYLR